MRALLVYIFCFPVILFSQNIIVNIPEISLEESVLDLHQLGAQNWLVDSILSEQTNSLSEILRRFGPINIKEYGALSTAFFRGLPSSNTQVLWNNIPLNSLSSGIVDLSIIPSSIFSEILINNGGHSHLTGSGAIGGSIQLNNDFNIHSKFNWEIDYSTGNFGTNRQSYIYQNNDSLSNYNINFLKYESQNDFEYLNTGLPNNFIEKQDHAYKSSTQLLINHSKIKGKLNSGFNIWISKNFREVPVSMLSSNPFASQFDNSIRSKIFWKLLNNTFKIDLSHSYLKEDFKYISSNIYSSINTYHHYSLIDFQTKIKDIKTYFGINFQNRSVNSNYYSNLVDENLFASYITINYNLKSLITNISFRKEIHPIYYVPNLYNLSFKLKLLNDFYFKVYFTKNFRAPSFNDLYWVGDGALGNINLNPEIALNSEFSIEHKKTSITLHSNLINQMIYWQTDLNGIWMPENFKEVWSRGVELKNFNKFNLGEFDISSQSSYAFTVSEIIKSDLVNDNSIGKQLPYVPFHKLSFLTHFKYSNWVLSFLLTNNGRVYTSSDETRSLSAYFLADFIFQYYYDKKPINLSLKVNNITNKNYQIYEWYPMPGRNYSISLNFKF